ncbi:MAG: cupin domain-containing protein [Pseudomonadota bacterium]|nr:cupin domain-containing protein [Pseudomonadota bacterium]
MNKHPDKPSHASSNRNAKTFTEADYSLQCLLGGMSVEKFLAEHWHKKPLLVRQALPNFGAWLDRESLSELACQDNSEGRLVQFKRGQCQLEYGPFEPEELQALPKKNWSLLVSGVNHLMPRADWLLHRFDFIPAARLDDLMVSFAPPGGGVGPHFDSYDVFLIQGQGRRRWEISAQDDLTIVEGAPLRILKEFRVDQTWEVGPGDMLYLPPQLAHNGVALTDCMTWSIGFRAPKAEEIVGQFLTYLQDKLELPGIYADPDLKPSKHVAEIPGAMLDWADKTIRAAARWDKAEIADFLGRYLSEPKSHVFFDPPARPKTLATFTKALRKHGVALDARSQMLFRSDAFFMNGERAEAAPALCPTLRDLADKRHLPPGEYAEEIVALLHLWYLAGYLA